VMRMLIDTLKGIASRRGASDLIILIETRPPRQNDTRGDPWQIGHDWKVSSDQKVVAEAYAKQLGLQIVLQFKDVPHGRYMDIDFADNTSATVVFDQGFGAWAPPRQVVARYNFRDESSVQVRRLESLNIPIERRGIGKTYLVATSVT